NGGIIIATRRLPEIAAGLQASAAEQTQVREISRRLFDGPSAIGRFVEDEKQLGQGLTRLLKPDVEIPPSTPQIGFIHRKTSEPEIYFVANTSNVRQKATASFRIGNGLPEFWDPFSGRITTANATMLTESQVILPLDLEPYGSRVLVFSKRALPKAKEKSVGTAPSPIDLSTGWRVSIGENAKPFVMDHLQSWTENEATRYFSGTATYEKEVT